MRHTDSNQEAIRAIARQVLPGTRPDVLERMHGGASTPVFRLQRGATTLYFRLAEKREASLAPEVLAHQLLRERGVRVPEVVFFEPFNEALQRAVMVTTEMPGRSLAEQHHGIDVGRVLREMGRDLAVINAVPVAGFGFVRRDRAGTVSLTGEFPTWRAFALGELDAQLAALPAILQSDEKAAMRRTVQQHASLLDTQQAVLAHGDFDVTHIYHLDGAYSGIIDFGEMRGADPLYDLGHFALHDGEVMAAGLLPHLLHGYRQVRPLAPHDECRIHLCSLLIGIRALARSITRPRSSYHAHLIHAMRRVMAMISRACESDCP